MKQLAAIAWKEWRENSPLLWIALGVFLGLPVIGGLEYMVSGHGHHFEISTEPGVIGLGGIFAILVAVGATCRDLNGKLEDFWRSRPVTVVRWMLVKFIIGLAIVMISLLVPLLVAWLIDRTNDDLRQLMFTLPAVWCLFYCIGFLAGCLLQRPAHAAVLALAALLLIYFVPVLLPSWNWVGAVMFSRQGPPTDQRGWTFVIAGSLFVVAMIAIHRYWRIEPGPRFMYGTIATAFLIFLFSTGYRLGTNLPVLQQIDLPAGQNAYTLHFEGSHGYVYTANTTDSVRYFLTIDLTADGLRLGSPVRADYLYWLNLAHSDASLRRGDVEYVASFGNATFNTVDSVQNSHQSLIMSLKVVDFSHRPSGGLVNSIPLPITASAQGEPTWPLRYIWGDRFYVIGRQLVTVDISRPLSPKVISAIPLGYPERGDTRMNSVPIAHWLDRYTIRYDLPQVPGLPDAERLQAAVEIDGDVNAKVFDGKNLFRTQGNLIIEYSLENLTPKLAIFKYVGRSDSELETLFIWGWPDNLRLQSDLLYVPQQRNDYNPVVKVYATTDHALLRLIGHFAAESSQMYVEPLADGRAIVVGSKIWLVGPPPHHD